MDANITLSLRDIYEEFLYNRDIGHEQIMYIIDQQPQESQLSKDDKQKLQKFLSGLDDKKKAILKERKSIPKFRLTASIFKTYTQAVNVNDKVGINGMIYRNLDVFKYNSEKLNLRERYNRDINESLQKVKGFAGESVGCIEAIIKYQKTSAVEALTSDTAEKAARLAAPTSVQEVPGPAKTEPRPFLEFIRDNELGNTQNENIVAPINEKEERLKETLEKSREDKIETKDEDVVVTGGGEAKGGDAIKHLNDEKNNPFLDVSKKMIEKACNLTADSCKISKNKCFLSAEKIADKLKVDGEVEINMDHLKNFIRRHDKYNSFIKYIYGKYFTLHSDMNDIINKEESSTFATEIVKNICIGGSSGSIDRSLYNSSYGNINLIANFFEDDILLKERERIKGLQDISKNIKIIENDLERFKKKIKSDKSSQNYQLRSKGNVRVFDFEYEPFKSSDRGINTSDPNKAIAKIEYTLTQVKASKRVDTFMNLYAGLNLVCLYGYNIFDEDIEKRPTIIKNLGIMMAMYEIESLDNHVRIARLNGHKEVADSLEKINLASQGDGDVRKQVRVTFENHFKLLKKSVMAQAKQAQVEENKLKQAEEEEEEEKSAKLAKETADKLTKEETDAEKEENRKHLENKLNEEQKKLKEEQEVATKLANDSSGKQGEKMDVVNGNEGSSDEETSDEETSEEKKEKENEFFKKSIGIDKDKDKRGNFIKELLKEQMKTEETKENEEQAQQVVAKNYIKIIQNCLKFNVVPWHVVKYTIDEMPKDNVDFSELFDGLNEKNLKNEGDEKTLLDQFFTDAFYWNTYEKENEFVNDFRIKVIRSTVTINDVYKSIRQLYIQNIQRVLQTKTSNESDKTFIDKFKESPMNPVYQKVLYDYFYKKYILNKSNGPKYFTDLYTSSSVEGIKIFYEGLENQVIRISQTNNEKFFMHAPGVMIEKKEKEKKEEKEKEEKEKEEKEKAAKEEIGNEAKLYFYDVNDKSFILDMMQKINIEEIDEILSKGDNVMCNVYKTRKRELRKYLNYFNIFMVAQAGNMKFIGKAYNRLRKQLGSILDSKNIR